MPGIEPGPPGWEPGILTTRPHGSCWIYWVNCNCFVAVWTTWLTSFQKLASNQKILKFRSKHRCCSMIINFSHSFFLSRLRQVASKIMGSSKPTRWGIVSGGRISNDFALALSCIKGDDHKVSDSCLPSLNSRLISSSLSDCGSCNPIFRLCKGIRSKTQGFKSLWLLRGTCEWSWSWCGLCWLDSPSTLSNWKADARKREACSDWETDMYKFQAGQGTHWFG